MPESTDANYDYATKDKCDIYERGIRPNDPGKRKRARTTEDYAEALELAREGRISDIDPVLQTRHYHAYDAIAKKAKAEKKVEVKNLPRGEGPFGVYIWGKPRTGKTTYVVDNYPDAFEKTYDKYWNGYKGEKFVVFEDIDEVNAIS